MNKIDKFLNGLGQTADEVAASLRQMKIKGYRNDSEACPLGRAVYLNFNNVICIDASEYVLERGSRLHSVPPSCGEFIKNFDSGLYSELLMEEKIE